MAVAWASSYDVWKSKTAALICESMGNAPCRTAHLLTYDLGEKQEPFRLATVIIMGKKSDYAGTPWYNFKIPQIYLDNKPDFEKIGAKIDKCLIKHFLGKAREGILVM